MGLGTTESVSRPATYRADRYGEPRQARLPWDEFEVLSASAIIRDDETDLNRATWHESIHEPCQEADERSSWDLNTERDKGS